MIRSNRENVMSRMYDMGIDADTFCKKLVSTGCIIAGSFPLQCLLGEHYYHSDIDVYAHVDTSKCEKFEVRRFHPFETWLSKTYQKKHNPSYYVIDDVICSRKYQITDKACINVVLVQSKDLEKFVTTNFDLSFCMTIFDGRDLKYDHLTLKKVGYIVNKYGMKQFKHHHRRVPNDDLSLLEGSNYQANRPCCIYPDHEQWLQRRLAKYQSRGFDIINAPTNHQETKIKAEEPKVKDLESQLLATQATVKKISDFFRQLNIDGLNFQVNCTDAD